MSNLFSTEHLGYSAMNTARSALSNIMIAPSSGESFGSHPLVKKLLRGMFNERPALPKYVCTFDVNIVLRYLKGLGDAATIPFKMLTLRLVTLLCLLSGQRDQTLTAMDVRLLHVTDNIVVCYIGQGLKSTRPKFHQSPLQFKAFPDSWNICPVYNMNQYLKRSFILRGPHVKLLISYCYPYHPVCTSTVSRWVKETLQMAGIDTNIFSSHSTRGASLSKAKSLGVSLAEINKAAGWANSGTFGVFYDKIIVEETNLGQTLLNNLT